MASPQDRRRSSRFAVDVGAKVQAGGDDGDLLSRITDASDGGMFVAMRPAPPIGTRLVIEIPGRGGRRSFVVAGKVVRRIEAPVGAPVPTGVGIEVTSSSREWLEFCAQFAAAPPAAAARAPDPGDEPGEA
jgi:hypothetical protein